MSAWKVAPEVASHPKQRAFRKPNFAHAHWQPIEDYLNREGTPRDRHEHAIAFALGMFLAAPWSFIKAALILARIQRQGGVSTKYRLGHYAAADVNAFVYGMVRAGILETSKPCMVGNPMEIRGIKVRVTKSFRHRLPKTFSGFPYQCRENTSNVDVFSTSGD